MPLHLRGFSNIEIQFYSIDNCGQSESVDANISDLSMELDLLRFLHRDGSVLLALLGSLGCFSNLHPGGVRNP